MAADSGGTAVPGGGADGGDGKGAGVGSGIFGSQGEGVCETLACVSGKVNAMDARKKSVITVGLIFVPPLRKGRTGVADIMRT